MSNQECVTLTHVLHELICRVERLYEDCGKAFNTFETADTHKHLADCIANDVCNVDYHLKRVCVYLDKIHSASETIDLKNEAQK